MEQNFLRFSFTIWSPSTTYNFKSLFQHMQCLPPPALVELAGVQDRDGEEAPGLVAVLVGGLEFVSCFLL